MPGAECFAWWRIVVLGAIGEGQLDEGVEKRQFYIHVDDFHLCVDGQHGVHQAWRGEECKTFAARLLQLERLRMDIAFEQLDNTRRWMEALGRVGLTSHLRHELAEGGDDPAARLRLGSGWSVG